MGSLTGEYSYACDNHAKADARCHNCKLLLKYYQAGLSEGEARAREGLRHGGRVRPREGGEAVSGAKYICIGCSKRITAARAKSSPACAQCEPAYLVGHAHGMHDHLGEMERSMRNVLGLAMRMQKRGVPDAEHLIRFCAEAGVVPSILRAATSRGESGGEKANG